MLAIIQEIGVIQSVIIAACFGFMLGMIVVIVGERRNNKSCFDDYLDWAKIRKGYNWVAVDEFLPKPVAHAYMGEPKKYGDWSPCEVKGWRDEHSTDIRVPLGAIIGPLPPWRESRRRRPS